MLIVSSKPLMMLEIQDFRVKTAAKSSDPQFSAAYRISKKLLFDFVVKK